MSGFLLDTNVPSELTRPRSDAGVERWLNEANDDELHLSVISLGELAKGIAILPESRRRRELQGWIEGTLRLWFEGRILPINDAIAERWGVLAGECQLRGTPLGTTDGLIAATALEHDLVVVTRNVKDFSGLGVVVVNPWSSDLTAKPESPQ